MPVADTMPDGAQDLDQTQALPAAGVLSVTDEPEPEFGATLDKVAREDAGDAAGARSPPGGRLAASGTETGPATTLRPRRHPGDSGRHGC